MPVPKKVAEFFVDDFQRDTVLPFCLISEEKILR